MPGFAPKMTATGHGVTGGPEIRLATYGTLAPGRQNHGQLSCLLGRWLVGHVRGSLVMAGWGAKLRYPGLILDPDGAPTEVFVFESQALPQHWHRLERVRGSAAIVASGEERLRLPAVATGSDEADRSLTC